MGGLSEIALFLACMAPQAAAALWAWRENVKIR